MSTDDETLKNVDEFIEDSKNELHQDNKKNFEFTRVRNKCLRVKYLKPKLTDEEMNNYDINSMTDDEYYDLRDKIWKEKNWDSHYEYQKGLSSFFNEDTGLTLYVHDVEQRDVR